MIYLYLLLVFSVMTLTVYATNKIIRLNISPVKYPEIDGMRGYLAFFVFLHHSYIWHEFIKTKHWEEPKSNLFNLFGQTSVTLFFIITAFLFITKIIEHKTNDFNWNKYIQSRFFRMFPMYLTTIVIVFIIVLFETNFEQKDSSFNCFKSILSWLFFSVNGSTDINGIKNTFIIFSAVSWTLPYEWMFYFLLPIFALFFKLKVKLKTIVLFTFIFLIILAINQSSLRNFMPFVGGIISAVIIHKLKLEKRLKQKVFSLIGIILLILLILNFDSGRKPIPIIISSIVFILIASGNSFFGLFSSIFSRKFGQITYSVYLIHGVILFVVFRYIIGFQNASELTEFEYWGIIALCVIPLIFISQLTYKYIELTAINYNKKKIETEI